MKKIIYLLIVSFLITNLNYSQELEKKLISKDSYKDSQKELSLKDAVLGYYLYPSYLSNLQWTQNDKIVYKKNDSLMLVSNLKSKQLESSKFITLETFTKYIPTIKRLPRILKISDEFISFYHEESYYIISIGDSAVKKIEFPESAENKDISNDENYIAFTKANNLYIASSTSIETVTNNEDKNIVSGKAIHRYEFGISKGIFWSPDNKKIAFYQKDETDVADYPLLDINSTPGTLKSIKYPMAGQKSEKAKIGIYNLETKEVIYLEVVKPEYSYLTNLTWGPNSEYVYVAELNRDQNHMQLVKYNANNGQKIKMLFEEKNEKWVEPEHPLYFIPNQDNMFIYLSERDAYMNMYLYNTDGSLIKQLTNNKWVIKKILKIDAKTKDIFFTGTGDDPRNTHLFSVNLKSSSKVRQITKEYGVHNCKISNDSKYIIDSYSNLETPRKILVTQVKSEKTKELFKAENPLINYKTAEISMLELKAEDSTKLYARIIYPHNFDKTKKYPVLTYVYGGPHAQLITNSWQAGSSLWMQWMANQGYIIFTLDGRGSAYRGFDFESVIHRELGKIEILDQKTGLNYLKSLPFVDSNRLAVYGWSFGGFMTASLMLKTPGIYTCGVAGGPVTDWKWYEVMYGERYMDTPEQNPEGYKKTSLLEYVNNLDGKLLMIHGTNDDVVVMQHNLAFIQKCVENGVQVDFFPYPMHPHNVRGKDRLHLMTKVLNYIIEYNH